MSAQTIAPYTLTDFGDLPDGTVFVDADQYNGPPLRSNAPDQWENAYRHIIGHDTYAILQMVKLGDRGWVDYGFGISRRFDLPNCRVITGPQLSQIDRLGGFVSPAELEVLRYLFIPPNKTSRFSCREIRRTAKHLFAWPNSRHVKRLSQVNLVKLISDADGRFVELTPFGILRVLQEQSS